MACEGGAWESDEVIRLDYDAFVSSESGGDTYTHPSVGCPIRTLPAGSPVSEIAPQSWI